VLCRDQLNPCTCNTIIFKLITGNTHEENEQQCEPKGFLSYTPITQEDVTKCKNKIANGSFVGTLDQCLQAFGGLKCREEHGINGGAGCCRGEGGGGAGGDGPDNPGGGGDLNLFDL
jgi:hypothetical protein